MKTSMVCRWLDEKWYPSFTNNWDDSLFRERVLSVVNADHVLLDLGAGAGIVPHMNFKGRVRRACGVDPDERVVSNPYLDEGRVGTGEKLPYPDAHFDVVVADNVVEHLADPIAVFSEVRRVLKSGGLFLFKTPNRRHYVAALARATPHWFHQAFNRMRGRSSEDTFPTLYRANTRTAVTAAANGAGLSVESVEFFEGRPEYLRSFAVGYIGGLLYERAVNSVTALESWRVILVATLRKP